ncbi:hypothetical protein CEV32_2316 [Brucella rhizosphaerae]|uniref:Uncharacterized protein n=1 Tax=Brucella rhizosphaerae TaxID=571254 RepID=A0A256F633_9HYPH|nr:hypothetical protein CEV32_2316 [Brucella rhizosphaerae]
MSAQKNRQAFQPVDDCVTGNKKKAGKKACRRKVGAGFPFTTCEKQRLKARRRNAIKCDAL